MHMSNLTFKRVILYPSRGYNFRPIGNSLLRLLNSTFLHDMNMNMNHISSNDSREGISSGACRRAGDTR